MALNFPTFDCCSIGTKAPDVSDQKNRQDKQCHRVGCYEQKEVNKLNHGRAKVLQSPGEY